MNWISNARIVAIFSVVCLHIAAYAVLNAELGTANWWSGNFYDAATRWCVPVFVMVSGALLLEPRPQEGMKLFYRKRASRVLLPLLFWTTFYLGWTAFKQHWWTPDADPYPYLERLLQGRPYFHLWFLYMIVFLYLFTPFLRRMVQNTNLKQLAALTGAAFVLSALSTLSNPDLNTHSAPFFTWFLSYLPYFLLGYLLRKVPVNVPRWLTITVLLGSIVATAWGFYALAITHDRQTGAYFYDYLSITVIPMSIALILLLRDWDQPLINSRISAHLAELTLGVYLIHPWLIDLMYRYLFTALDFNALWSIPVLAVAIYGLSLLLTAGFKATPVLRATV
ncbi:acyltransferase family protein [Alcaligenes sp. 1735tsa3]|uniref:Acyltransferase family protein n=1 Tax=Alcaligenes faecalis TaxID=511 RepID=A0AAE9KPK4_ALCFA|nr:MULTISPECIES: acyltransferase family protein [Alcaligenes]UPL21260.1 acyltransferase family protein [Alcaligenes faecalis]USY25670.1 acyltransferase family protein [Alcaligenes sp. 1735tsa3]